MADWRTTKGAILTESERIWIKDATAAVCEGRENPVVVHIGVEYGGSLHCSRAGAPGAYLVGVDIDLEPCIEPDCFALLIEGDSAKVCGSFGGGIDFLFIDGAHDRASVEADMDGWLPKVKPGGIVAFHDYNSLPQDKPHTRGVKEAVDARLWSGAEWERIEGADSICAFRRRERRMLRAGDSFGRVAFGVPYFKPSYEFWRWFSWVLIGGMEPGDVFLNDNDMPGEVAGVDSHNALVRAALQTNCDTLCIVEDDHCDEDNQTIRRLRSKPENLDYDIVCASYTNRRGAPKPVGFTFSDWEGGVPVKRAGGYRVELDYENTALEGTQEVDGSALGCVLIRRWVLEVIAGRRNLDDVRWFVWDDNNSLDIGFYALAQMVGARCAVDRDVWIQHVGKYIYTKRDFVTWRENGRRRLKEADNG